MILLATTSIINATKASLSVEVKQKEQEEMKKAILGCQLKEIRQQYHTVFNANKQQLLQSDKGTKKISLKNESHHKWSKNIALIAGDSIVSCIEKNRILRLL